MAEKGAPLPDPALNFEDIVVSYPAINKILHLVKQDLVALKGWGEIRDYLVTSPEFILEINACKSHSGKVRKTLEFWISEMSQATGYGKLWFLVDTLHKLDLGRLANAIRSSADTIRAAGEGPSLVDPVTRQVLDSEIIWFGVPERASNVQYRQEELDELDEHVRASRDKSTASKSTASKELTFMTNMYGLGGVGKTTLAKLYAWDWQEAFKGHVVWINASSVQAISKSFLDLIKTHNLVSEEQVATLSNQSPKELATLAYTYFQKADKECLFVLDAVDDFQHLKHFRPRRPPPFICQNLPYVLATSRTGKTETDDDTVFPLGVFSDADATAFIKKRLHVQRNDSKFLDCVRQLSETVGYLPLALQQAIPIVEGLHPEFDEGVKAFVKEYDGNALKVLDDSKFFIFDEFYLKTVYKTFTLAVGQIREETNFGLLAIKLLEYMSFLDNETLHTNFLMKMVQYPNHAINQLQRQKSRNGHDVGLLGSVAWKRPVKIEYTTDDQSLTGALRLLDKYSLIHLHTSAEIHSIEIHKLVQDVLRLNLEPSSEVPLLSEMMMFLEEASKDDELKTQALLHGYRVASFAEPKLPDQFSYSRLTFKLEYDRMQEIRAQVAAGGKYDIYNFMVRLANEDRIARALLFLNKSSISVEDYTGALRSIEHGQPVLLSLITFLKKWLMNVANKVTARRDGNGLQPQRILRFLGFLDTDISLNYFFKLIGDEYTREQILEVLQRLQEKGVLMLNSIKLDPVVKYALSLLDENDLQESIRVQARCVEFVEHCLDHPLGESQDEKDALKDEASRHGFSILISYLQSVELKSKFPVFALKVCSHLGNLHLLNWSTDEGVAAGRRFALVIEDVFQLLEADNREAMGSALWVELKRIQERLYSDKKQKYDYEDIAFGLRDIELKGPEPDTRSITSGIASTYSILSEPKVESKLKEKSGKKGESGRAPDVTSSDRPTPIGSLPKSTELRWDLGDILILHELVLEDPCALEKWEFVVNYIVRSASDRIRIKNRIEHGYYEEGVLRSLQLWYSYGQHRVDLLRALRDLGLNRLADKIQKGRKFSISDV